MKRGLILGIGALALAGMTISARAADMPVKAPPPIAAPPPPFSWTACYIGGNLGGKRGSIEGSARSDPFAPLFPAGALFPFDSDSETGFVYGGQVGCAWQTGSFVWGIEGDFNGTDISRDFVGKRLCAAAWAGPSIASNSTQQAAWHGPISMWRWP